MRDSDIREIEQLQRLHKKGALTQAEFAKQKAAVLKRGGSDEVRVTHSTLRFVVLTLVTFGFYPLYLFYAMRAAVNKETGHRRTPFLHTVALLIPILTVYPLYVLSQDLRGLHRKEKLRWPMDVRVEYGLIGVFAAYITYSWILALEPLYGGLSGLAWVLVFVLWLVAMGYFIRLLWSFNDYWRKRLGDDAKPAPLGRDVGFGFLWFAGAMVAAIVIGIALVASNPELNGCYDDQIDADIRLDEISDEVVELEGTDRREELQAAQKLQQEALEEKNRIDADCLRIEEDVFGF